MVVCSIQWESIGQRDATIKHSYFILQNTTRRSRSASALAAAAAAYSAVVVAVRHVRVLKDHVVSSTIAPL